MRWSEFKYFADKLDQESQQMRAPDKIRSQSIYVTLLNEGRDILPFVLRRLKFVDFSMPMVLLCVDLGQMPLPIEFVGRSDKLWQHCHDWGVQSGHLKLAYIVRGYHGTYETTEEDESCHLTRASAEVALKECKDDLDDWNRRAGQFCNELLTFGPYPTPLQISGLLNKHHFAGTDPYGIHVRKETNFDIVEVPLVD
jgi:hypothetical protein